MRYHQILREGANQIPWNGNPTIGWWLDNDPVTFYHGTHISRLEGVLENGLRAPTEGATAGWVSLALEPNTGHGYASMTGGETAFRAAGAQARSVPHGERITFVLQIPQSHFLQKMAPMRGGVQEYKDKLTDRKLYEAWKDQGKTDQEYYAVTEIRLPDPVPAKFIVGYMKKKG